MIATGRRLRFDGGKWVAVPYFSAAFAVGIENETFGRPQSPPVSGAFLSLKEQHVPVLLNIECHRLLTPSVVGVLKTCDAQEMLLHFWS
jgi:hypothetical protein